MNLSTSYMTRNECFSRNRKFKPIGVMIHSTGANNPNLSRYIPAWNIWHPGGEDLPPHKFQGKRTCGICGGRQKCVHGFVGLDRDGKIASVQTAPFDMPTWHCGGSGNNSYIGFEICEDDLKDPVYFAAAYREAAEFCAYICRQTGINPARPGAIICHADGHRLGIASNHADVLHWFKRHGKTMNDFRKEVMKIMDYEKEIAQLKKEVAELKAMLTPNPDAPVSEWAAEAMHWGKKHGITDGTRPKAYVTREECVTMIHRACALLTKIFVRG